MMWNIFQDVPALKDQIKTDIPLTYNPHSERKKINKQIYY